VRVADLDVLGRDLGDGPSETPSAFLDVLLIGAWVARDELLDLYPDPVISEILAIHVQRDVAPLLVFLDDLVPQERLPAHDVLHAGISRLLEVTVPSGVLDPGQLGTDVPWGLLVGRLLDRCPEQARWTAGTYAQHLERRAREEEPPGHPVVCAVAGYLVAATELVLGRPTRAAKWSRESDSLVEFEVPPGVGVATYVRSAMLLSAGRARSRGEP
jgi:hypothetical protein